MTAAGWLQLVEAAQRQAVAGKKDLLIVFGASDTDGNTHEKVLGPLGHTTVEL
mgnify:CR=1 FL=1